MIKGVIYAPCAFGKDKGKTGNDLVIYSGRLFKITGVIDPCNKGRDAGEVLGIGYKGIPVLGSLDEALRTGFKALIIGTAPVGGRLPVEWAQDIIKALENGVDVYNGLHDYLSEKEALVKAAEKGGARIFDVRKPDKKLYRIWDGSVLKTRCKRVLVAGTDCGVGKNIASIELYSELERRGPSVNLVGTGQTMLLLGAKGVVIDSYPLDFAPGVMEKIVADACRESEIVIVEGQSAILHPAYGQAALSILYGVSPTHVVLSHEHGRRMRVEFTGLEMPAVEEELRTLFALNPYKDAVLAGISLFSRGFHGDWDKLKEEYRRKFGAPVADPLKERVSEIADNILNM